MRVLKRTLFSLIILHNVKSIFARPQITINSLPQLPNCALQCVTSALANNGCRSETDFRCHCTNGRAINNATPCLRRNCRDNDQTVAINAVIRACGAMGVGVGGDREGGNSTPRPTLPSTGTASTRSSSPGSTTATDRTFTSTSSSFTAAPTIGETGGGNNSGGGTTPTQLSSILRTAISTSGTTTLTRPPQPTDTPLALDPTSRSLSNGAKAGIGISVTAVSSFVLISLLLYIRQLKQDLRAAQAAAGIPESVWREHIEAVTVAGRVAGRGSGRLWRGRGRTRGEDEDGQAWGEVGEGAAGGKQKRGHVLSVVVERVDEEDEENYVREPVVGQREGLVGALELDGDSTEVCEAPASITPKRSREQSRERWDEAGLSIQGGGIENEKVRYR